MRRRWKITRPPTHKTTNFWAMVADSKNSPGNHVFEEMDGNGLPWAELSAAAKLQYLARDAAFADVRFEIFAEGVKETIGDVGDAALRVVLDAQKKLHAIAKLFPDDERTEPTPLVEQVKEILDHVTELEARESERHQAKETFFKGISDALDGKPPERWFEEVKAFRAILRGDHAAPEQAETRGRGREL